MDDPSTPFRGSDAVRAGRLTRGVLRGPGFARVGVDTYVAAPSDDPLLTIRAAVIRAGPTAVVTGWSACAVHGLDVAPGRRPVELAVPDRRLRVDAGIVARRQRIPDADVVEVVGLRTTTPLRTAFDLATRSGPVRSAIDPVVDPVLDAVAAVDALGRWGGFTAADLTAVAADHVGARGVRRVAAIAALMDPRADSPPESRVRTKVVLAGLPRPAVRFEVRDDLGYLHDELDLAWPVYMVALEYDGKDHARRDRRWRDVDRHDALRRDGWHVVTVTARQLARPRWVPDRVREALVGRGWVPDPALVAEWARVVVGSPFWSP